MAADVFMQVFRDLHASVGMPDVCSVFVTKNKLMYIIRFAYINWGNKTMADSRNNTMSQQEFLRDAMAQLSMTRQQFADRIRARKRRVDTWLLPSKSKEFRELDPTIWQFVREILQDLK